MKQIKELKKEGEKSHTTKVKLKEKERLKPCIKVKKAGSQSGQSERAKRKKERGTNKKRKVEQGNAATEIKCKKETV